MQLKERKGISDGWSWRCNCRGNPYKSVRHGSFFARAKVTLQLYILTIYLWSKTYTIKLAADNTGLTEKTIAQIYIFLREVASGQLLAVPVQLGGPGKIVEIDESLFRHKSKYHRGRYPANDAWVFGMVDRSSSPSVGVMEIVADRTATTLLAVLRKHVLPGTTVRSDMWAAYRGINNMGMGYIHETVNHSQNFVSPNGVHTQAIESYWAQTKLKFKAMKGVHAKQLPSYLDEKMWRDVYANDSFNNIILHISNAYTF